MTNEEGAGRSALFMPPVPQRHLFHITGIFSAMRPMR
jgi:hypothetical protein